jgi:hypothetical protein
MRKAALLPVFLTLTSFGLSAASPKHPTQDATPSGPEACAIQFSGIAVHNNRIDFAFANSSNRTIQNIEFGAAVYDRAQQLHRVQILGDVHRLLRTGQQATYDLDIKPWKGSHYAAWMVYPSKVIFTDGTAWEMESDHASCDVEKWLKQPSRASATPLEALEQIPQLGAQ